MYYRIRKAIFHPRPDKKPSMKNALLQAFKIIGLDTQKIRESWKLIEDKWGLVEDIIAILKDFGFIFEIIEYQE